MRWDALVLFLILENFHFFTIKYDASYRIFIDTLYWIGEFPSILSLLGVSFFYEKVVDLVKYSFSVDWDDHVFFSPYSANLVYVIETLTLNQSCNPE